MLRKVSLFVLLTVVFSLKNEAQEINSQISADELMKIVINKTLENDRLKRQSLIFQKRYIIEDLSSSKEPKPKKEDKTTLEGKGRTGTDVPLDVSKILALSYIFRFESPVIQIFEGRACYVVHFEPNPKSPPVEGLFYEVANRSEGTIYIDKERLLVLRVTSQLTKGFNQYGYLGRIKRVELEYNQELRPDLNNLVVIESITAVVRYRIIYLIIPVEYFEKYTYIYSNYQIVP